MTFRNRIPVLLPFANIYYQTSVSAGGGRTAIHHKGFHPHGDGEPQRSLNAHADLDFVSVNRVFETPVLGGQLAVGLTARWATTAPRSTAR
jgi:hypothetical protein